MLWHTYLHLDGEILTLMRLHLIRLHRVSHNHLLAFFGTKASRNGSLGLLLDHFLDLGLK